MAYLNKQDQKDYAKRHYEANKDRYKNRAKKHTNEVRKSISKLIKHTKDKPCSDCGVKYPYYVMDFDHIDPSEKKFTIGRSGSGGYSLKTVQREIDKCDVVCSNCHRERTHGGLIFESPLRL